MSEWVSKIDGRPLYRYRISDAEFQRLKMQVKDGFRYYTIRYLLVTSLAISTNDWGAS